MVEENGVKSAWVTGLAPSIRQDLFCGMFMYDQQSGLPMGEVYGYLLDDEGNLRYLSAEDGGKGELVLPANCAVGVEFDGIHGRSSVYAVGYSGVVQGMDIMNAVVLKTEEGFAFYQESKGLVLMQTGFDGGEVTYRLLADAQDDQYIYHNFVE